MNLLLQVSSSKIILLNILKGVQKYDGFSSKDADLFLRMSSKENEVKTEEKTDESLEKVPPENYMREVRLLFDHEPEE